MPYGLKWFQKAEALHCIAFSCFHRLPFREAPATKETFEFVPETCHDTYRVHADALTRSKQSPLSSRASELVL